MTKESNNVVALGSSVPPPPMEVRVRTMHSDIEGVAKSGGGMPQYRNIPVEGMGLPKSRVGGASSAVSGSSSDGFPRWIIAVMVIVLGILLWFGYTLFLK